MSMRILGFQKLTLLDYPGKLSAIVFISQCNFQCPFCYNVDLVLDPPDYPEVKQEEVFAFLKTRHGKLDGVVVTGGEPCVHPELPAFLLKLKAAGFKVKLDTNGTNPGMLRELLDAKVVDYVAMDVKNSLEKYEKTAGVKVNMDAVRQSIGLLISHGKQNPEFDYEFRTTVVPGLVEKEDIAKIMQLIPGAKAYYLQQFRPGRMLDAETGKKRPYDAGVLKEMKQIAEKRVKKVGIRGLENC